VSMHWEGGPAGIMVGAGKSSRLVTEVVLR
jgi:hypothetical protein